MSLLEAKDPGSNPEKHGSNDGGRSALAKLLPLTTVGVLLAALYVGWIFYSRAQSAKDVQAESARKEEEARKKGADLIFGGGAVKFLVFSASEGHLKRGQSTRLCYGMVNAVKVTIEPAVSEEPKPTSRHCVDIAPKETTTYKITASNQQGQENSSSLTVHVE